MTDEEKALMDKKEAELKAAQAEIEKANKRVDDAQGKIHEWEAEVGDTRKDQVENAKVMKSLAQELVDANAALRKAGEDLAKAREELASAKKEGPEAETQKTRQTVGEKIATIEATLTDEDRKALDAAIEKADEDQRKAIDTDDKTYLAFLEGLRESNPKPSVPRWRNTPEEKQTPSSDVAASIKALFTKEKKRSSNQPNGPSSSANTDFRYQRPLEHQRPERRGIND